MIVPTDGLDTPSHRLRTWVGASERASSRAIGADFARVASQRSRRVSFIFVAARDGLLIGDTSNR
jgi:hypothetical protein